MHSVDDNNCQYTVVYDVYSPLTTDEHHCIISTISLSIDSSFSKFKFLPRFVVISQIFLSIVIKNKLNFLLCCSFCVQLSELYKKVD